MIYVLCSGESGDDVYAVCDGPEGVDVDALHGAFQANFDYRTLGRAEYPPYDGPQMVTRLLSGSLCLGSGSTDSFGGPAVGYPDTQSLEYKRWRAECERITNEWNDRCRANVERFRVRYPGHTIGEMFLSYLKAEHGFVEVAHRTAFV